MTKGAVKTIDDIKEGFSMYMFADAFEGAAITPEVTSVKVGDLAIVLDSLDIKYSNNTFVIPTDDNINSKDATVTITAKDNTNYSGTASINYTINRATYTITYTYNGVTSATHTNPSTYVYGKVVTLTDATKTGYTFNGWTYEDQTEPTKNVVISVTDKGNKTFTANFDANTYYISFNKNDVLAQGEMTNQEFEYDETKNLSDNVFTKTGYTFKGWSTTNDGTVVYNDKASITNLTSEDKAVIDLYAVWEANQYIVTFDLNKGTSTSTEPEC